MSLMLEFQTAQNPEARSAGIGTNWCFPTVTRPTNAIGCKGGTLPQPNGKAARDARPTSHPKAIPAHSVSRSPDREPNTSELPVNDLLTNSGNSD